MSGKHAYYIALALGISFLLLGCLLLASFLEWRKALKQVQSWVQSKVHDES